MITSTARHIKEIVPELLRELEIQSANQGLVGMSWEAERRMLGAALRSGCPAVVHDLKWLSIEYELHRRIRNLMQEGSRPVRHG